jgi:hypothetical protein
MSNNVTDRILLKAIYDSYYDQFCAFNKDAPERTTKNFVPIDFKSLGKSLDLDSAIVFGRLYYHLDKKYRYRQEDGALVPLFQLRLGEEIHLINFPLLSAVLAELEQDYIRFTLPLAVSFGALAVSVLALVFAT